MTFELKYSLDIKYYKISFSGPGLVSYINTNYTSNTKIRQLIIGYIYCLNGIIIF